MIRLFCFVVLVFGLGCGENAPEPVHVDPGYSMSVQCVVPPRVKKGPFKVETECTSFYENGGVYRVTFQQSLIDSLVIGYSEKYCNSLPILDFETQDAYDPMGKSSWNSISCGWGGNDFLLNRGDTTVFYINHQALGPEEGFTLNQSSIWIDSAGVDVVFELWFYNPISRGYGFRRKNRWEWR